MIEQLEAYLILTIKEKALCPYMYNNQWRGSEAAIVFMIKSASFSKSL
jgi:hypothetical protein